MIEPPHRCVSYPWAGHHVFRSDWSPNATWLFFESGPRGTGHHDCAQLSIQLTADGVPFLVDPGFYSYSNAGEPGRMAAYLRSTAAHNAATVDGAGQQGVPIGSTVHPNAAPGQYYWRDNESEAVAEGIYTLGFGPDGRIAVTHRRLVIFDKVRGSFQIDDEFQGIGQHEIALCWQVAPGLPVEIESDGFRIQGGKTSLLAKFYTAGSFRLCSSSGQKNPLSGWYSDSYGQLEPTTTIQLALARQALPVSIRSTLLLQK